MKLAHGLSLLALLSVGAAGPWLGCSSTTAVTPQPDGGGNPPPGQDSGPGPVADTGTTPTPDSGGTDAGAGDTGAPVAQTCAAYCTAVQAACTGANAQYVSTQECLNACSFFPAGTSGDKSGLTLGCKIYHAGVAAATPTPHCWHAGPFGFGGCGASVDSFCTLAVDWCSPDAGFTGTPPYASLTDCTTAAANYTAANIGADGGFYASGPGAGNSFDCRAYHLGKSMDSTPGGANQQLHCKHPGASSATCQ